MFPKFNLSRLSGFAALGLVVAVLGGCAESTSGTGSTILPDAMARTEATRAQSEIPVQHAVAPLAPSESIAYSHKVASHRLNQGSALH